MNPNDAARLAAIINGIHPEWPNASLLTFITRNLANRPYPDAVVAFVACAIDPDTKTPARLLENGPWWKAAAAAAGKVEATPTPPRVSHMRCDRCGFTVTEPDHRCAPRGDHTAGAARARAELHAAKEAG